MYYLREHQYLGAHYTRPNLYWVPPQPVPQNATSIPKSLITAVLGKLQYLTVRHAQSSAIPQRVRRFERAIIEHSGGSMGGTNGLSRKNHEKKKITKKEVMSVFPCIP